jgi:hypothetical protein
MKRILKFNKDVLRVLCEENNVYYPGKSQKADLVNKLFTTVSCMKCKPFGGSDPPLSLAGPPNIPIVLDKREAR